MSLLSRLFGGGQGGGSDDGPSETYKSFTITPTPIRDGGQHRVSARIDKEVGGEMQSHTLIRADAMQDRDEALRISVLKAKQLIDERGDRLFDSP